MLLDVRNGTETGQEFSQKKGEKECYCIYSTSFKCNGPTGVLLFYCIILKK
jgi:hypothetical protein